MYILIYMYKYTDIFKYVLIYAYIHIYAHIHKSGSHETPSQTKPQLPSRALASARSFSRAHTHAITTLTENSRFGIAHFFVASVCKVNQRLCVKCACMMRHCIETLG